ncbi:hypothetical protein [Nocardioides marmoraquaticus]
MRIPREIETKVVSRLYADAIDTDWPSLTSQEHSAQYARWLRDNEIGGRLREYLTEGEVRVWIKDGPMKELSRAMSGVGRYAALIPGADQIPARLVLKALGEGWEVVAGSVRGKPLRLTALRAEDDAEAVVTWGQPTDLKHLVWAALVASAEGDARPWTLCVTETFTRPTPANEKKAHQRLATRCDLTVKHVSL